MTRTRLEPIALFALTLSLGCGVAADSDGLEEGEVDAGHLSDVLGPDANLDDPVVAGDLTYPIVETWQQTCYGSGAAMTCAEPGSAFSGQDAQYQGIAGELVDNGDGTINDRVTGLMWQQDPGAKMTWDQAMDGAASFQLAGYDDWRLPTIRELYSLMDFSGVDPSGYEGSDTSALTPFISDLFDFQYGDEGAGERIIDAQFATSTLYVSETMDGETMFGVNFADGRIKGYGTGPMPGGNTDKEFFVLYVRGETGYGVTSFSNNGDGTVSDEATGLTWQQADSGDGLDWDGALGYCERLELAGNGDWRLPNAKELHSILDYTRSPSTTDSAAIDPVFDATSIINEAGVSDFAAYWTSTTHVSWASDREGANAVYINFGRAMGYLGGQWQDVHGAGAQRSDPKTGDPDDYPTGHGPQGDAIRIFNQVRCVRSGANLIGDTGSSQPEGE